jgi:hypothetical protein
MVYHVRLDLKSKKYRCIPSYPDIFADAGDFLVTFRDAR